jgi:hypothetical protein
VAAASAGLIPSPYAYGAHGGFYGGYYGGAPLNYAHASPVLAQAAPIAVAPIAVAPAIPHVASSQYQAQDEFGNVNYGYSNINSAKQEIGNTYTGVTGSYQYVDANNIHQRVDYIADDLGFRITGATNLPVAPTFKHANLPVAPIYEGVAPLPVGDTPEVAAAKLEFFAAFEEAKNRAKRDVVVAAPALAPVAAPLAYAATPLAYNYGQNPYFYNGYANGFNLAAPINYAAPVHAIAHAPLAYAQTVSAPAAREAVLTTVKLNPGHAVAYRVY